MATNVGDEQIRELETTIRYLPVSLVDMTEMDVAAAEVNKRLAGETAYRPPNRAQRRRAMRQRRP